MQLKQSSSLGAWVALVAMSGALAAPRSVTPPDVGPHSIGGTVIGPAGPEAGVWVIAETSDRPSRFVKIVVTDDQGRFVLPDLPRANYQVWSRGYGLLDSARVQAAPGKTLELKVAAASALEAARIYPPNYWSAMIRVPDAQEFPGTGPKGNGIAPGFKTQQHWLAHLVENCQYCHALGTKITRELADIGDPLEAWAQRIQKSRLPDDVFNAELPHYRQRNYGTRMSNYMTLFGRERGLGMFADWTSRVAKGETPPQAPARPVGVERNVVITLQDMGQGRFLHDSSSSDKRNPSINAGGPIYGYATYSGMIVALDPNTGREEQFKLKDARGDWFLNGNPHTGTMDSKGRVWVTDMVHYGGGDAATAGKNPAFCTDPANKFAKYFPRQASYAKLATVFDPKTKKDELLPVCFGTHHLNFDKNERLYFSGETEVIGWIDVNVWDETKDVSKAVGWCPMVLDTNGDGVITPDRSHWNEQLAGIVGGEGSTDFLNDRAGAAMDPRKDTRIAGMNYGMGISPKDQSYWSAKYSPYVPSGIVRLDTGANPPYTCKTEYYEPPKVNGEFRAFNARGVDVDSNGIVWVGFGSGAIGKFDRSKCKVLNGPTATGQHCPEGWEIIDTPGPKYQGTSAGSDWFYLAFVDHHDALGLGKDIPVFPNSTGDELLAYLPAKKQFVHLRVPYPLGFYARLVDGRIDDPTAGWKGRGLWATNNVSPLWHQETGEEATEYAAHFQLRPDPLAQ